MERPSSDSPMIVAVIPLFRPDADTVARVATLRDQVSAIVAVDDGSGPGSSDVLSRIAEHADLVREPQNRGIAYALNVGCARGLSAGADFILTLDQDTDLEPDTVARALGVYRDAHPVTRIGLVAPERINTSPALPPWTSPEGFPLVPEVIQSGALLSREALITVGLFDERLIIDYVDTEFCLRLRDHGFHIALAPGSGMRHALGVRAPLRPFGVPLRHADGRTAMYGYHAPFRRYYITRNAIDVVLRNLAHRPRFAATVARREWTPAVVTLVSGPHRARQGLAILVGAIHGVTRRRGLIPGWLARLVRLPHR